jgi:crotonobetaine/carnitine-CoA ligase
MKNPGGVDITKIRLTTRELMREAARSAGDKAYLVYVQRNSEETFRQFEGKVNRISHYFVKECGVRKGDKVCTMSENIPELLHTIMAITNVGAVWVPINSMLVGESLKYIVEASDSAFVCVSDRYSETVAPVADKIKTPLRILPINELSERSRSMPDEFESPARPDDESMIIFTSGTTGFPKGVLHTHNTYIRTAVRGLEALETDATHRIHVYLPFFHGWAYLLMLGALYHKCTMIMEDRFHADTYWETIEKYRITQDHWTGTVPINLMKMEKGEFEARVRLKILGTFGALYAAMKERWPNLTFQSLYGQTEHPFITEVPPDQIYPGSDGIPKPPDQVLILDDGGNPVPQGEVGEIVCRCRCGVRMREYYRNLEATAKTIRGDDLYTGDLGRLDERGHLHFVGRKKDAFRVRGEMVSAEHVEHLINGHPKVAECAIVGYRPPEKEALKEDEIIVHLVLKQGETLTAEAFNEWSQENLPRFMRPRYLALRDKLPKTATERVQRFKLREEGIGACIRLY